MKHNLRIVILSVQVNITVEWKPEYLDDCKSTLVMVMAWCHQATSHYQNQCWPKSLTPEMSPGHKELNILIEKVDLKNFVAQQNECLRSVSHPNFFLLELWTFVNDIFLMIYIWSRSTFYTSWCAPFAVLVVDVKNRIWSSQDYLLAQLPQFNIFQSAFE